MTILTAILIGLGMSIVSNVSYQDGKKDAAQEKVIKTTKIDSKTKNSINSNLNQ